MKWKLAAKRMAVLTVAATMITAAAGCGNSGGDKEKKEGADKGGGVTITVGLKASHVEISNINTYKDAWEKKTGNKVDVQAIDDNQFDSLLQTKMSTSGMWDIFIGDTGTQSSSYQHEKNLVDLSGEAWVDKLTDTGKEFVTNSDGKIYCFQMCIRDRRRSIPACSLRFIIHSARG